MVQANVPLYRGVFAAAWTGAGWAQIPPGHAGKQESPQGAAECNAGTPADPPTYYPVRTKDAPSVWSYGKSRKITDEPNSMRRQGAAVGLWWILRLRRRFRDGGDSRSTWDSESGHQLGSELRCRWDRPEIDAQVLNLRRPQQK